MQLPKSAVYTFFYINPTTIHANLHSQDGLKDIIFNEHVFILANNCMGGKKKKGGLKNAIIPRVLNFINPFTATMPPENNNAT